MRKIRFALTFAAGVAAAALALGWPGAGGPLAATRYEDLSLFTEVLNLVRKNCRSTPAESSRGWASRSPSGATASWRWSRRSRARPPTAPG